MNYCQFRNEFIKRMAVTSGGGGILPAEYQQVEWLQSSGTQYIDTGVLSNVAIERYYCKAAITGYNSNNYLYGGWYPNSRYFIAYNSSVINFGYTTQSSSTTNNLILGAAYEFSGTMKPGNQTMYIDNVLKISQSASGTPIPYNVTLLACNDVEGGGRIVYFAIGKLYKYELETTDGLIRDMYPCYRKSDNKPGMYDLVTNTFFTNAGSGEFTVGNDVL